MWKLSKKHYQILEKGLYMLQYEDSRRNGYAFYYHIQSGNNKIEI